MVPFPREGQKLEDRFATATYRTNPRYAMSPTYGAQVKERTQEERAAGRERVRQKRREEEIALQAERDRIASLTAPKHIKSHNVANDSRQNSRKVA